MAAPKPKSRTTAIIRHVIYALVALAIVLPYIIHMSLPAFTPSPIAKQLFDQVDALEPGSHVLLAFDFDPASRAELYPMGLSIVEHCFKKGVIPVVMTNWNTGLNMDKNICEEAAAAAQKKWGKQMQSGRDYVFLGFNPGLSQLVLLMGRNIQAAFDKDYFGQPTRGMPAMNKVNSLKDFKLMVDLAAGDTVGMWIAYGTDKCGLPLGVGTTAVQAPDMYPFLQSHQLIGLLGGLRGAADYEQLLEISGDATLGMQSQSFAHILLIGLIVFANVRFLMARTGRGRKG